MRNNTNYEPHLVKSVVSDQTPWRHSGDMMRSSTYVTNVEIYITSICNFHITNHIKYPNHNCPLCHSPYHYCSQWGIVKGEIEHVSFLCKMDCVNLSLCQLIMCQIRWDFTRNTKLHLLVAPQCVSEPCVDLYVIPVESYTTHKTLVVVGSRKTCWRLASSRSTQ